VSHPLFILNTYAVSRCHGTGTRLKLLLYNNVTPLLYFLIMFPLSGPTPIHSIGTFRYPSMNATYFLQFSGRSSYDFTSAIDVFQPGKVVYITSVLSSVSKLAIVKNKMSTHSQVAEYHPLQLTWETREFIPIKDILHPDFDFFETIKNVKLGEVKRVITIDQTRMLHHNKIEPATTPEAACCRANLMSDSLKMRSDFLHMCIWIRAYHQVAPWTTHVELLSGERPPTHPSRVRFNDTNDLSDATWRNAEAGTDSAGGRRTARHVRICPIVDVEHQRVRALDKDALARGERFVHIHDAVNDERA
jgi:hypothetical protein